MDAYIRNRIENITEKDFWSSIAPSPEPASAIKSGMAGNRAGAYRMLGHYHARSLAAEKQTLIEEVREMYKTKAAISNLRRHAEMVLRHEIRGWQDCIKKFGKRIDFNSDFGQSGQYGFHYLFWLRPVLHEYVRCGEDKYRRCLLDILGQYYRQRGMIDWRIPHIHPVYYELGSWAKIGLMLPAYAFLAGDKSMSADDYEAMLKLLLGFARSLYRIQETGYRAGNHQIAGVNALYWMGCTLHEFREASQWRRRARRIMLLHVAKDYYSDGGHGERCWGYGRMSLRNMLKFYRIGLLRNHLKGSGAAAMRGLLKKSFRWFAATVSPTLDMPNYGDGAIESARDVFTEAIKTFPEMAEDTGLLGVDRSGSCILYPSGYAFMRHGDGDDAPYMSINFGPSGGWHTHDDLLDFTLWRYGQPIIEEAGRFGSYDHPLNPLFRSAVAHNQIVIEHCVMNRNDHRGRDVVWHSTDKADFFSAFHLAYKTSHHSNQQVKVQRHIVFVKPQSKDGVAYWVIHDVVTAMEYIFQASSYLHATRPFRILRPGLARVEGNPSCLVALAEPDGIRRFQTDADYTEQETDGLDREHYKFASQRHRLVATSWRDIGDRRPITFTTLLMPFKGRRIPQVSIQPLPGNGTADGLAAAFIVKTSGRRDIITFNPQCDARFEVAGKKIPGQMAARIGNDWIVVSQAPRNAHDNVECKQLK